MAKLSSINKNNKRIKLSDKFYNKRKSLKIIIMNKKLPLEERFKAQQKLSNRFFAKRKKLKEIIMNKQLPLEERFKAQQKLAKLPRNSAKNRIMNRCQITGRPHGVYRKLKISRIALRQLGLQGKIPGMVKSSW